MMLPKLTLGSIIITIPNYVFKEVENYTMLLQGTHENRWKTCVYVPIVGNLRRLVSRTSKILCHPTDTVTCT